MSECGHCNDYKKAAVVQATIHKSIGNNAVCTVEEICRYFE